MSSIVSTDNALETATGKCSVCLEEDVEIYLCQCNHWACEGCLTTVVNDSFVWTGCDKCPGPTGPPPEGDQ